MSSYTLMHNKYSGGSVWRVCCGVSDGRSDGSLVSDECGIDVKKVLVCSRSAFGKVQKWRRGKTPRHDVTHLYAILGTVISSMWEARPGSTTTPEWQFGWILFILISMFLERQTDRTGQQSLPSIKMILSVALLLRGR